VLCAAAASAQAAELIRLHPRDFLSEALKAGIAVEVTLFSSYYQEAHWNTGPFNAGQASDIRRQASGVRRQLHHRTC